MSTLILFIAAMGVAATVTVTLVGSVGDIGEAIDQRSVDVAGDINTEVSIISDTGSDPVEGSQFVLYVKNTGSENLVARADTIDVFANGQFVVEDKIDVTVLSGGVDDWRSGDVVEMRIGWDTGTDSYAVDEGEVRVQVVVGSADDTATFQTG